MAYTIKEAIDQARAKWPDREFIFTRQGDQFAGVTYGNFAADVYRLASALLPEYQGKHIMLLGPNSYQWMVADAAIAGFVGVSVAANWQWGPEQLAETIGQTDCAMVLYAEAVGKTVEQLRETIDVPCYSLEIEMGKWIDGDGGAGMGAAGTGTVDGPRLDEALMGRLTDEPCKIMFSSGTTGRPKAVLLSQRNIFAGVESLLRRTPIGEGDRTYLYLPLSHTYGGIYNFFYPLLLGIQVFLCSGVKQMPEELLLTQPTIFCGVPATYEYFAQLAQAVKVDGHEGADAVADALDDALRGLFGDEMRFLFCGGSPADQHLIQQYLDSGLCMLEAYALTETASSFAIAYPGENKPGSCGTVFENIQVRIVEADSQGIGEIAVKGDNVFLGYYDGRREVVVADARTDEGYFMTGDLGCLDEERALFVVGRKGRFAKSAKGEWQGIGDW